MDLKTFVMHLQIYKRKFHNDSQCFCIHFPVLLCFLLLVDIIFGFEGFLILLYLLFYILLRCLYCICISDCHVLWCTTSRCKGNPNHRNILVLFSSSSKLTDVYIMYYEYDAVLCVNHVCVSCIS